MKEILNKLLKIINKNLDAKIVLFFDYVVIIFFFSKLFRYDMISMSSLLDGLITLYVGVIFMVLLKFMLFKYVLIEIFKLINNKYLKNFLIVILAIANTYITFVYTLFSVFLFFPFYL